MLGDLRSRVVAGQQDVGERLVVAHQHVEARLQLLDEIGFEKQRFRLGHRRHENHRRGQRDHPCDTVGVARRPHVTRDALAHALGFADVQDGIVRSDHAVDARAFRSVFPERSDDRRAGLHRCRRGIVFGAEGEIGPLRCIEIDGLDRPLLRGAEVRVTGVHVS